MSIGSIYQYILLFIATIATIVVTNRYRVRTFNSTIADTRISDVIGLILCIFCTFFIGLRPNGAGFGDSSNYRFTYNQREGTMFWFEPHAKNLIWDNLFNWWASQSLGISMLFLLGDALYFGCTYLACRKWFPRDTFAAYAVFLGAFSTFSYSCNGVKAGIAASIFLLGLSFYDKKWLSITIVLISWGFHHSMQLPVVAYIFTLFFKNPKWYFYGWVICSLMAVLHVTIFQELFVSLSEDSIGYLDVTSEDDNFGGASGFRPDFMLYSVMPVLVGYKIVIKEKLKVSKLYSSLLHVYLCANGTWMLCMYASYTNRIAYLSWFMYPFVLIYPFLKEDLRGVLILKTRNQYAQFVKVASYHLAFTLFMDLVFYKFLK